MGESLGGWIVKCLGVGLIAAVCAYVISYGSYQNQFMDSRSAPRLALQTAGSTFLFFFLACLALPWLLRALRGVGAP
jgi:hypothetical protein